MNKYKFYRVEHSVEHYPSDMNIPVKYGPYTAVTFLRKSNMIHELPAWKKLDDILTRNEPANANPKKERLAKIGLFSTFVDRRPGPREDPGLRGKLTFQPMLLDNPYVYGFDSLQQLNDWFHDDEEREQLHTCGFGIGVYYVTNIIKGLRQSVVPKDAIMRFLRHESLLSYNKVTF